MALVEGLDKTTDTLIKQWRRHVDYIRSLYVDVVAFSQMEHDLNENNSNVVELCGERHFFPVAFCGVLYLNALKQFPY